MNFMCGVSAMFPRTPPINPNKESNMKYQIIVIVIALILTALALTSCMEQCESSPRYVNGERHILVTTGDGAEWVAH